MALSKEVLDIFSLIIFLVAIGLSFYVGLHVGEVRHYVCYTGYEKVFSGLGRDIFLEGGCFEYPENESWTCSELYNVTLHRQTTFMLERDVAELDRVYTAAYPEGHPVPVGVVIPTTG
jgi:hypothetical protein